eukprot:6225126-Amphidinium_carterae.1
MFANVQRPTTEPKQKTHDSNQEHRTRPPLGEVLALRSGNKQLQQAKLLRTEAIGVQKPPL